MKKVLFTQGLPASGKSTWARAYCEKNTNWIRVNRDALRHMRGKYWLPKQEDLISQFEKSCILTSLNRGYNVIVDATNLNLGYVAKLQEEILKHFPGAVFEYKEFDTPVDECIKRDMARADSVGADVIKGMYKKYIAPKRVRVQDHFRRKAIIVDLDGTVCIHNGRSPYDLDKVDTDLPNAPVIKIVENYLSYGCGDVIFLSGREDKCREKSLAWIKKHIQLMDTEVNLFMRKTGDTRRDSIVKEELFDEHIFNKYFIEFILDDRNQVVEMWRELGLTCLQVAEGNF